MKKIVLCAILLTASYNSVFAYLSQGHWRWRNNDGTEASASWKAAQDSGITISDNKAIRLRIDVYNAQSSTKGYGTRLEYATTLKGPWIPLSGAIGSSAFILAGDNAYVQDYEQTTPQLTGATGYNFAFGRILTQSNDHNDSILVKQRKEYEWCIKPTSLITPNTKYYFRASLGGGQITNLPNLTTGPGFAIPPAILTNGGFEQGLAGWQNSDTNGGNTFAVEDTAVYDGNQALRVVVKTAGVAGSVQTVHAPFATSHSRIYLVRFWAKGNVNAAGLTLAVQGAGGTQTVKYKLITNYAEYQYAFKTNDPQTALRFYYTTNNASYVLDKVTVQDDTDPLVDVNMTYMWQTNRSGYGWLTGDGQESIKLPDGRVAWFFSDSWLGVNDTTNNFTNTNRLINNTMVVQNGTPPNGVLNTYYTGTPSNPNALMLPVTSVGTLSWYWPRDPVIENNTLKILLNEFDRPTSNADVVFSNIHSVATISLPDLKVQKIEDLPYLGTEKYTVILQGDSSSKYNYVYGGDNTAPFARAVVARYPKGQLSAAVPWEFYTGNNTWSADHTKATPIYQFGFGAVIQLGPNNYAAVILEGLANTFSVVYAPSPLGPWTNTTVLYQLPPFFGGYAYFPYLHKETGKNGIYTVSYSTNTTIGQMLTDKGTYQPRYFKADLLGLSPFTIKKSADSITKVAFATKDREAIIYFNTANKDDTGFQIQHSMDGASWSTITSVAGGNSTSHATKFDLPGNGLNYYRILLYDADKKISISKVAKFNVVESATVSNFTATANTNKTDFTINTTQERFNHNFYIARSADGTTNWQQLLTVPGMGITNQSQAYTVSDNSPLPGKNYYRLVYYLNGKLAYSAVKLVDFTQNAISLTAYPNPTANNISFALKGYTGKQITVKLTSLYGKPLGTETFAINPSGYYSLKTRPTSSGTYLLTVSGTGLNKTSRVMVQ